MKNSLSRSAMGQKSFRRRLLSGGGAGALLVVVALVFIPRIAPNTHRFTETINPEMASSPSAGCQPTYPTWPEVHVGYTSAWQNTNPPEFVVTQATVSNLDPACDGATLTLTLGSGPIASPTTIGTGSTIVGSPLCTTIAGSPSTLTCIVPITTSPLPAASAVQDVSITLSSTLTATTTVLASSPTPSLLGESVTLTATVTSGSGTPTGTVSFYLNSTSNTPLNTATLSSGKATYSTTTLPVGSDTLYAVYNGNGTFASSQGSTTQTVIGPPVVCASSGYTNFIIGSSSPVITGTNQNDFIYAFVTGVNYVINGEQGNDCIWAGAGNDTLTDGNGNDGILAGSGNNVVTVGNGTDKITLGDGTNTVTAGNGTLTVVVGNGNSNVIVVGGGADSVTIGTGSSNLITLGAGADTVRIGSPAISGTPTHDTINGGAGNETIYLGSGTFNTYNGQPHHTNICYLPAPPASYHGTPSAYYHDTITNCTVVSS